MRNDFSYVRKRISEFGHVVRIENGPFVDGYVDKFGNRIAARRYYFENGRHFIIRPWSSKPKLDPLG